MINQFSMKEVRSKAITPLLERDETKNILLLHCIIMILLDLPTIFFDLKNFSTHFLPKTSEFSIIEGFSINYSVRMT